MAGSMKAIKNRIKSVESTKQITKAMELVATSKLRRAKERIEESRPYFDVLKNTLDDIAKNNKDFSSPFCKAVKAENPATCYVVIAGDRGLAGGYNSNLFKSVLLSENDVVLPIGKKAVEYFARRGINIFSEDYAIVEDVSVSDCAFMGEMLAKAFLDGKFDKLKVVYTRFINVLSQTPAAVDVLPAVYDEKDKKSGIILYEPSAESVFNKIIPQYIGGMIYGGISESYASELSARRNAMQSANKNADEMISSLSLSYNRARQAAITQEITEIVAGAEN
ncbi:MAG: ATP synthase F1 subunit gamma [Clostridia bacterium]|nr:ATP synthase F1 subunit gamma [Clostridia bacterium]